MYSVYSLKAYMLNCSQMQHERDRLLAEVENLSSNSDGQTQKLQDVHSQKLKALESQVNMSANVATTFIFKRDVHPLISTYIIHLRFKI